MGALGAAFGASQRRGTPIDLLVVGLGNPGSQFVGTRHNVGAEVAQVFAERHGGRLKLGRELALVDELRIGSKRVAVACPQTYMNKSGDSVGRLVRRYGVSQAEALVVVHDELDLPVGQFKLKLGGGLAGNNGLRSIKEHLKTDQFARIRIGIGRPPSAQSGADYVLRAPSKAEREELNIVVEEAADAIEMMLEQGFAPTMNRYNTRKKRT
ncbi:MAG: aminoacyl-tRNA hydrolase [Acidimicrobiia bacterium]